MGYNINFEFLDDEAIENAITCLNYRMDKVIFFGEEELIREKKAELTYFLTKCCKVGKDAGLPYEKAVEFYPISDTNLDEVIQVMKDVIKVEEKNGNHLYIDVTGGEGLALLAFGIIAKELNLPMHLYDIETGELREFLCNDSNALSKTGVAKKVPWNIDTFVKMQGGVVKVENNKAYKASHSPEDLRDIDIMWTLMMKHKSLWTNFTSVIALLHSSQNVVNEALDELEFRARIDVVKTAIRKTSGFYNAFRIKDEMGTKEEIEARQLERAYNGFHKIMKECLEEKLLERLENTKGIYRYTIKNEFVAGCLREAGGVLEQYVYKKVTSKGNKDEEWRVGVHIDWDIIDKREETEVLNEIDVLGLKGYIPIFISCKAVKITNVNQGVLYELDTVARRLGGKYAKKVLAVTDQWRGKHRNRAKEMEIEVWDEYDKRGR